MKKGKIGEKGQKKYSKEIEKLAGKYRSKKYIPAEKLRDYIDYTQL